MKRSGYRIMEYGNGNLSVKIPKDDLTGCAEGRIDFDLLLNEIFDSIDCIVSVEPFTVGNFEEALLVYNLRRELCYTLLGSDIDNVLKVGKSLRLYAREPDEMDAENIEQMLKECF